MAKTNPILAQYKAVLDKEHREKQKIREQISIIAMLRAANKELQVGKGRSGFLLAEYIDQTMEIAKLLLSDDDSELLYTKRNLAISTKAILGDENWKNYRELLPFLKEYWEI